MVKITTRSILSEIGCKHLALYKGTGYWYFIYDDGKRFEEKSVYTMRLNDLKKSSWVQEGKALVAKVEAEVSQ